MGNKEIFSIIITAFILTLTVKDLCNIIFKSNIIYSEKKLKLTLAIYFTIIAIMELNTISYLISLVIAFIITFLVVSNYKVTLASKIFATAYIGTIIVGSEMALLYLFNIIFNIEVFKILNNNLYILWLLAASRLIPFIVIKIIGLNSKCEGVNLNKKNQFKHSELAIMCILSIFGLQLIYFLTDLSSIVTRSQNIVISIIATFIACLNIMIYTVYFKAIKRIEFENKDQLIDEQINNYYKYYEKLKYNLEEVRIFKHDTKHIFLNAVSELSKEEEISDKSELLKRVDTIVGNMYSEEYKCYSGNSVIDMILNNSKEIAKTNRINIDFKIDMNLDVNIEGKTLAVILGNILDNAIEACILHEERKIKVKILNQKDNLYISVSNRFKGRLNVKDSLPETNKKDYENHGIGLKRVKQLVEDNKGIILINTKNDIFTIHIYLINDKKGVKNNKIMI